MKPSLTRSEPTEAALDQVMQGARVVAGIIAASLAQVGDTVTAPQLRVLVVTAERGKLTLGEVAAVLGVHPSNATRLCDRLVLAGLLDRRDDPRNRRQLQLTLTGAGSALVDTVMNYRREALRELLRTLPATTQTALGRAMGALAGAATSTDADIWAVPLKERPGRGGADWS